MADYVGAFKESLICETPTPPLKNMGVDAGFHRSYSISHTYSPSKGSQVVSGRVVKGIGNHAPPTRVSASLPPLELISRVPYLCADPTRNPFIQTPTPPSPNRGGGVEQVQVLSLVRAFPLIERTSMGPIFGPPPLSRKRDVKRTPRYLRLPVLEKLSRHRP